jgi:Na+/proline symporter
MQLYVPLLLGLYWPRFSREAAIAGLLTGTLTVSSLMLTGVGHIWIFDAGVCGFVLNGIACVSVCLLIQPSEAEQKRVHERFFYTF